MTKRGGVKLRLFISNGIGEQVYVILRTSTNIALLNVYSLFERLFIVAGEAGANRPKSVDC